MWTMSRDSGALAYVQSPGTPTSRDCLSSSATNPPPSLVGGGDLRGAGLSNLCRLHHEIVPLSVQREVIAALVRAGALLAELHEDVVEERRGAEPVQIRSEPLRAERLVHEHEMLHRLLRLPDSAG